MTKRKRISLVVILIILFFVLAPSLVFYSLGWRFDWQTKKIIQTGAFYFKVWPKNAEIYLNNKLKKKTDFFFGSSLIENLLPRKYNVEIKKRGFYSWQKTLQIESKKVTEAKNIILFPKEPKFEKIGFNVSNFFFAPDEEKIILNEINTSKISPEIEKNSALNSWALKLFNLKNKVKARLLEEENISLQKIQILGLKFSPDSKRILIELGAKERIEYYLLNIDEFPPKLTRLYFLPLLTENVYFHPTDTKKLFLLENGILKEIDIINKEIKPLFDKKILALTIEKNNLFFLTEKGFFFQTTPSFRYLQKLNLSPFPVKKETEYKIFVSPNYKYILFQEDKNLYWLKDENNIKKISEGIKGLKFSPDYKKIVFFNNFEIQVFYFEKESSVPQKEAETNTFITRFSKKINNVFWLTNYYLIFNVENKIKIAETDDRDKINIIDFAEFKNPKIFWSQVNKQLYILSEKNLFSSEKLIP